MTTTDLPTDWKYATVGEMAEVIQGQSPPGETYNQGGEGLPFFQGKAEFGYIYPTASKWCTAPTKIAQKDDVLISMRAPVGPTNLAPGECCIGRGLAAIRPHNDLSPRYLLYAIRASVDFLVRRATGSTFQAISGQVLRSHHLPVAPLEEQHRIVEAIESNFARLEAAAVILGKALTELDRYRSSVLWAACWGNLVPSEDRDPSSGNRVPKVGGSAWTPSPLPCTWTWKKVRDVGDVKLGRQRAPQYHFGPHMRPYLRVANVFEDRIDLADVKAMEFDPSDYPKYKLEVGDILLNEGQSPELVGRPAMIREPLPGFCFQNTLIRFRAHREVLPQWALVVFRAYVRGGRFRKIAQITTNIAHLGVERFSEVEFPVPPLAEQKRLSDEVERRLSIASQTEGEVHATLHRTAKLRQAVLSAAFLGRLTQHNRTQKQLSRERRPIG